MDSHPVEHDHDVPLGPGLGHDRRVHDRRVMTAALAAQRPAGYWGTVRWQEAAGRVRRWSVAAGDEGSPRRAGYRRSAGTARGEARRRDLLERVGDDRAVIGLVGFSLRRGARAAGTRHKVLLYYFDGAEDLLQQAIWQLRERRIANSLAAVGQALPQTLAARVRAVWPALVGEESRVLDQAIGLMMYDSGRYAGLGQGASQQYMPSLLGICPPDWPEQRKVEVSELVLAALRGFLIDLLTSGHSDGAEAGFEALARAPDRGAAASALP